MVHRGYHNTAEKEESCRTEEVRAEVLQPRNLLHVVRPRRGDQPAVADASHVGSEGLEDLGGAVVAVAGGDLRRRDPVVAGLGHAERVNRG